MQHVIRHVVYIAMPKTRACRYSIEIKDAEGRSVLFTVADWDEDERRAAIARLLRLDGVLEANSSSEPEPAPKLGKDISTSKG